jgi:hypothetical protein
MPRVDVLFEARRNFTTSYKGQLLEINFTSNLNTNPELKQEIDHIMGSVHLEE